MKRRTSEITRRTFLESVAVAGAAAVTAASNAEASSMQSTRAQTVAAKAPDGAPLKAGLIGCGGRGRGAAENFLDAGSGLQIVALADLFEDRVLAARQMLNEKRGQQIPESRCFTGFDAYRKLLDSGVDIVLHATPPHFRPMHMAAVVDPEGFGLLLRAIEDYQGSLVTRTALQLSALTFQRPGNLRVTRRTSGWSRTRTGGNARLENGRAPLPGGLPLV